MINQEQTQQFIINEQQSDTEEEYSIITQPKQYLQWCRKDKKIKIMDQLNPLHPSIYLKDISLHKKGPLQDKIYAKYKKYYYNIRRGNTLCELYDKNNQSIDLFFCRRGMIKFYDLQPQYLKVNPKLTYRHKLVRKIIFSQIQKKIDEGGYKFHLYSLFKQNGEHCQIGYIKKLESWLIASKNVTIIVNKISQLQKYQKQRFYWAKLIAQQFFRSLKKLNAQQIQNLKMDIENKTLIAEYCGYEKHQHITKYNQIQIIYYAIVQNTGAKHCIPVQQAFRIFDKYKLKKVRTKVIKNLVNQVQMFEQIYKLSKQVGTGNIIQEGEGSVLYIVSQKNQKQQIVSLCKLKTIQYLIFRKLRQMLKIHLNKKGETANTIQKYKFDIMQIIKNSFEPPRPLEYYIKIGEMAFKQVQDKLQQMQQSQLRYRFVNFLQQIQKNNSMIKLQQKKEIKQNASLVKRIVLVGLPKTFESDLQKILRQNGIKVQDNYRQKMQNKQKYNISVVYMVPRISQKSKNQDTFFLICDYSQQQKKQVIVKLNKQKQPYNQNIISFIKNADKQKQIDLLLAKIQSFKNVCKQKALNYEIITDNKKQILNIIYGVFQLQLNSIPQKPQSINRYLIMPLLIPGSGKSTLSQTFTKNKNNMKLKIVCADKIRKEIYDQIRKNNPQKNYSSEQLFKISHKQCKIKFEETFNKLIETPITQNQFIFIDRIFVPLTLDQKISQLLQKSNNYKIIFITQDGATWRNCQFQYPFSLTYLLNCFKRSIEREDHQTLFSDQVQTLKIILKFYQMFRNFKFNNLQKKYKNSKILKLPFVSEKKDDDKQIRENIKNKLKDCLKCITPGYDAKQSLIFSEFIDTYYTYEKQILVRNPDPQNLKKLFLDGLQKIIKGLL